MASKQNIKKGDIVFVVSGNDKGKEGEVIMVMPGDNKAVVEGVNIISKHTKPTQDNPQGGVIKKEAPVHMSNLMIKCPETGKPTRIGRKKDKNGKSVRYSKKSKNKQEIK